ncbi:MAG: response regulator [Magnetovibrio sp.]|nr:response regulator [Magnetovibrio sp.]
MAKILVIDDDQDILDFIQGGLEHVHDITTALNGELGLRACEDGTFDLVLTDIFMPFRDGLDIVREVAKLYPDSKTVAMTGQYGSGQTDYLKAAHAFGAVKTLQKPFTIEQLSLIVEEVLSA